MFKDDSLRGQRVVVTAGASGIGLVVARGFIEAGARVFVCDVDEPALQQAMAEVPALQGCVADVAVEIEVVRLFEQAEAALGGLDVLINNAGIAGPTGPVESLAREAFMRTLEVNVTGQFLCAKHAVPRLRKGRTPAIVNMSSAAGHLGMPGRTAYSSSKWAVVGLTKSLAIELGRDGIRVNAVLPGSVDGPRIRAVIAAKAEMLGQPVADIARVYEQQSVLARMSTPEDVANTVLFACSGCAATVTGQALAVDGMTQNLT